MLFRTQYPKDPYVIDSEKLSKESLFEFGTYRDTQTMVEEFLVAGRTLQALREHQFDDIDDDGDFSLPTTRDKSSDIVDIHDEYEALNASISESVNHARAESVANKAKAEKTEQKQTVEQSDKTE